MTKRMVLESDELADLQRAVIRMLWTWQARKDAKHPEADKYIDRYQQLYLKITGARWSPDET